MSQPVLQHHTSYAYLLVVAVLAAVVGLSAWYLSKESQSPVVEVMEPEPKSTSTKYTDAELEAAFAAPLPPDSVDHIEDEAWHDAFAGTEPALE